MARRIFLGDVHMGDERGVNRTSPLHNYGWFSDDRPGMLTQFLDTYCTADDVAQVVIVGDLFDEWVCPAGYDPIIWTGPDAPSPGEQYRAICNASQNKPVIEALRNLAAKGRLVYLPGNHDVLADKSIIDELFGAGVFCDNEVSPGHYVYQADGIWAEHGHWYGMFNAPLPPDADIGYQGDPLPIGYFLTRILTGECLQSGERIGLGHVIKEWLKDKAVPRQTNLAESLPPDLAAAIIEDLFNDLVKNHAQGLEGAITKWLPHMPDPAKWKDIGDRYAKTFTDWPYGRTDTVGHIAAVWGDAADLDYPARSLTLHQDKARIVIFGHTHSPCIDRHHHSAYPDGEFDLHPEVFRVYANAGAWAYDVDDCTFVETEVTAAGDKHVASVMKWVKDSAGTCTAKLLHHEEAWVTYP